jgi:hypothetical protein
VAVAAIRESAVIAAANAVAIVVAGNVAATTVGVINTIVANCRQTIF